MKKIQDILGRIKIFLEKIEISPIQWIISFSTLILGRIFLESISNPTPNGIMATENISLIHLSLWFLSLSIILMIYFWTILPEWRKSLPVGILFAFLATWIAPILDLVLSVGKGFRMTYLFQNSTQLTHSFLTFFGNQGPGATIGIRIEIAIVLLISVIILYATKKYLWKSLIMTFGLYTLIFVMFSAPSFLFILNTSVGSPATPIIESVTHSSTLTNNISGNLQYESETAMIDTGFDFMMARIYIILIFILGSLWFLLNEKDILLSIIKNSRPERVLHYWLMAGAGMYLAWQLSPWSIFSWNDLVVFMCLLLSIYSAWMFSVCTNDIADIDTDLINCPDRPLTSGSVNKKTLREAGIMFLIISLLSAYTSGYYAFFCIIAFLAFYYTYSMPPTRLKKVPVLSSLIISLNCVAMFIAGFFTFSNSKLFSTLPIQIVFSVTLITFLWSHIRDLKDLEGDSKTGIRTIPVMFGAVWGPRIVGIASGLTYVIVAILLQKPILYPLSITWGLATYFFCTKRPYKEYPLFILYFSAILLLLLILRVS